MKDKKKRMTYRQLTVSEFFQGLDFNDVLEKKVQPKFVPTIENKSVPSNFDAEFTTEQATDSFVMPVFGSAEKYPGFSYVEPELQNVLASVSTDDNTPSHDGEVEVATPE